MSEELRTYTFLHREKSVLEEARVYMFYFTLTIIMHKCMNSNSSSYEY